uniref:Uncharacterized protein n=2 Tax=Percolomonas cosmopolitus TaxID=63605 RepID=A0A7S1KQQ7_9EUKA|mmetsp:Transcript_5508/g.20688  ORF Transcript_5508/g.20688 Transcript_5508/m.20688 type:complete len:731 (+) Transcript_5508:2257-4449(+)
MTLRKQVHSTINNAFTNLAALYLDPDQATLSSIQLFSIPTGTTELDSSDLLDDQFVDYEQLIFDIPKALRGEISAKDFVFNVQTVAQKAAQVQVKAVPFLSAVVDEQVTLVPQVQHLRVPRGDTTSTDVWKYIIETVGGGAGKRDAPIGVSIYSGYIHQLSQASNYSLVENGELSFSVDHLAIDPVDPAFWIQLDSQGANSAVTLKVKEYRFLRSGQVLSFPLSDVSQFVLYQDQNRGLRRNQIGIRSEAKNENGLEVCSQCSYKLYLSLELEDASERRQFLWNTTFLSANGSISVNIDLDQVAQSGGPTLAQLQEALLFVKSESLSSDTFELNLMTNDIMHFGGDQTQVSSRLVRNTETGASEILYYKLPTSLIDSFSGTVMLQLTVNSDADASPEIFVQRGEYPRRDSHSFSSSKIRTRSLSMGFVVDPDTSDDYYVGISSMSSSFDFDLKVQHLYHAEILMSISLLSDTSGDFLWISDDDIREIGLLLNFTILNQVHEFSPSLFDLTSGDAPLLRSLLGAFDSADEGGQGAMQQLRSHLYSCLDRAISSNDTEYRLSDFVLYSPHRLTLIVPPLEDFKLDSNARLKMKDVRELGTSGKSKRTVRPNGLQSSALPAKLFSTLDARNVISSRSTEVVFYKSGTTGFTFIWFWVWFGVVCIASACAVPLSLIFIILCSSGSYLALRRMPPGMDDAKMDKKPDPQHTTNTSAKESTEAKRASTKTEPNVSV